MYLEILLLNELQVSIILENKINLDSYIWKEMQRLAPQYDVYRYPLYLPRHICITVPPLHQKVGKEGITEIILIRRL